MPDSRDSAQETRGHAPKRRWWVAGGASLVLALGAIAAPNYIEWCATPGECSAFARARAEQLAFAGDTESALSVLLRDHQRRRDAETSAALSEHFERAQDPARALHFALEAHAAAPGDAAIAVRAARLLRNVDPRRADRIAAEVLAQDPDNVGARITRSQLARSNGDPQRALEEARRVATPEQVDPDAWHHLGRLIKMNVHDALAEGRVPPDALFDEGIEALARATALDPDNWVARLERVWLLSVWPGHRDEARNVAWRAYRATFATVPSEVLERHARAEMLTLARRLGDRELERATLQAKPGAFAERRGGS